MELGSGGAPLQVLGEKEALQQFFSGSLSTEVLTELSCVLDSSAAVDTSILEQYLSMDADPSHFILPDSPPDSIPEACSPPPLHIADCPYRPPHWPNQPSSQEVYQPPRPLPSSSSCGPLHPQLLTHDQLRTLGLTNTYLKPGPSPSPPPEARPHQHTHLHSPPHTHHLNAESCWQVCTPPMPPLPLPAALSYSTACVDAGSGPASTQPPSVCLRGPPSADLYTCSQSRKRRRSEAEEALAAAEGEGPAGAPVPLQLLAWDQYRPADWCVLLDRGHQTLGWPAYHVDTDKGFSYSPADEAFVCQKKNHFQVTVRIGVASEPCYVQTGRGRQQVEHFQIQVFGIKLEAPSQLVTIEQSQSDRSKKPFHPVRVSLPGGQITKVTLGRLHFAETTNNNMRKKGKPNPDQRYFQMVVGLYATVKEESFLLTALVSERLIVRASNPGQFEMEGDTLWQRGIAQDALVCQGRVGINTDSPDEALVVCGNAKVMGAVIQPSDRRAKHNIQQVDSEQQLRRITQMRLVEFDYKPEFASSMGIDHTHQTGILAQEVKELLPSAVKEVGDITCSDGEKIPNFLMVDKEQIFMENVGAVQQLSKLTDNLESRINELEVWNQRLAKLKSLTGSLRSARKPSSVSPPQSPEPCKSVKDPKKTSSQKRGSCLQHRVLQASIFTLLATMAFCVISITALYLLTLRDQDMELFPSNSSSSVDPLQTTVWSSSAPPTSAPGPWPPDVDFCELLYCDQVYCCPSPARGAAFDLSAPQTAAAPASELKERRRKSREELYKKLRSARSDWTNTTIGSFTIKESQQAIDSRYCLRDECGPGRFAFRVPISQFLPVNMRVTLLMNSTELLVVHLCGFEESASCSAVLDASAQASGRYPPNTQGEHEWPLHVARLHHSSYHFRSTVAGQADCSTDHHYAGALFTDYHFHFYRRCESR